MVIICTILLCIFAAIGIAVLFVLCCLIPFWVKDWVYKKERRLFGKIIPQQLLLRIICRFAKCVAFASVFLSFYLYIAVFGAVAFILLGLMCLFVCITVAFLSSVCDGANSKERLSATVFAWFVVMPVLCFLLRLPPPV